ncbi:MAG: branched-chain amino acid ABC transporter permease [Oscillospiraceae bacterium]
MKKIFRTENVFVQLAYVVLAIAVLFLFGRFFSGYNTYRLAKIMFLGLAAMGLCLMSGFGGHNSLAQAGFAAISGYTLAIGQVYYGWSYGQCVVLGLLFVLIVSFAFALLSMRCSGNYFFVMTIALANMLYICALQWVELTRGYNGIAGIVGPTINGVTLSGSKSIYYIVALIFPIGYFILKRITKSPYGIALQGYRDNREKMAALGFSTNLIRIMVIMLGAFFAGLCGVLSVTFYGIMSPDMLATNMGFMILFMSLIGGIKKIEGGIVGAAIYVFLEDVLTKYTQRYKLIIGILFVLVVLFMPGGVLSLPIFQKKWWIRQIGRLRRTKEGNGG